jgi:hypothetical protein
MHLLTVFKKNYIVDRPSFAGISFLERRKYIFAELKEKGLPTYLVSTTGFGIGYMYM